MYRRLLVWLVTIGLSGLASDVSAQVTLKPKFAEGTQFRAKETQKVDQILKLAGNTLPSKSTMTFVVLTSYGQRDAEGNLPIKSKFEATQAEILLPGGRTLKFDSADPDAKASDPQLEAALDQFRKLTGLEIIHKISRDNTTVVSVERSNRESQVDPEDLKEQFQQSLELIPTEPIKQGDTWERAFKQDLGQGQILTFQRKFEYAGQVAEFETVPGSRNLDKITATDTSVVYSVRPNTGLGLTVKKSDLKIESSKHTYLFDRDAGRFVDTESEIHITGALSLSINQMDLDGDLDLTLSTREQGVK
ncbi:MAG TPA: DUF6263 family protein [Pirellulales bacterium]|nr:DUF6263 family protein [Pirellulales bacterium]